MVLRLGIKAFIQFPSFLETYLLLKESQWWSKEKLEDFQFQQLKKLINHSYKNVPYYSKLFKKLEIKPENIKSLQDIELLSFLTKDIVFNNSNSIKASNYPEYKFDSLYTGGSTGKQLQVFVEKGVWSSKMLAFGVMQNEWTNRSYFDKCLVIKGINSPFKYHFFGRILTLSSFYMNDKNFPFFINKIRKLHPKHIYGYPSAITNLAIYMKRNNIKLNFQIKSILCFSETLYEWQNRLLVEIFQCPVYQQYSLKESVALGISFENNNYFHIIPEFSIVELIGKNGSPVKKEDEVGEIVGTGFYNYIFPLIRYRTGDLGVYTEKKCDCGRNYPLLKKIEGRLQEFVVSKTNQILPLTGTGIYSLVATCSPNVIECQLYQEKEGEIILNIVKTKNYKMSESNLIQKSFNKRFGNDFNLKICFVDNIPRTKSGKYRFLIQKLPINNYHLN